ncbi:SPOR domain-containing protein [Rhodoferax sp. PAMC 29310]|uniref:SPOR domain-containing protein n=1 Tax=Rhodoferax sp. PAMC 29310 TaxID=2822760 RepID=UPI001B3261F6|nr:SPOR domain-containing protein [Rhodoferax sp. PAMC 29310]
MAFFKFRKRTDEPAAAPAPSESVEAMRRRAKYRLIGATVLVLIGVLGFPMLFDKQPRPIAVDTPIDIPDKNKVQPLSVPAPAAKDTARAESSTSAPKEEIVLIAPTTKTQVEAEKPVAQTESKTVAKSAEKPVEKVVEKPVAKVVIRSDDGAKALALLQGRAPEKKAEVVEGRFVVQVGAFAEEAGARAVRLKVEAAGLKTYTHVAQTKEGSRIRVRTGPYSTRDDAEKAAEKIKKLGLPAAILTL